MDILTKEQIEQARVMDSNIMAWLPYLGVERISEQQVNAINMATQFQVAPLYVQVAIRQRMENMR